MPKPGVMASIGSPMSTPKDGKVEAFEKAVKKKRLNGITQETAIFAFKVVNGQMQVLMKDDY